MLTNFSSLAYKTFLMICEKQGIEDQGSFLTKICIHHSDVRGMYACCRIKSLGGKPKPLLPS